MNVVTVRKVENIIVTLALSVHNEVQLFGSTVHISKEIKSVDNFPGGYLICILNEKTERESLTFPG